MKGPFDEITRLDRQDATRAYGRGEPLPPPTGKPAHLFTPAERKAVELRDARWKRMAEEDARIDAALKRLSEDRQRDEIIKQGTAVVRELEIPTAFLLGDREVLVGAGETTKADLTQNVRDKIEQAKASPPKVKFKWWPAILLALVESFEAGVKAEVGGLPHVYMVVRGDRFVHAVQRYQKASAPERPAT